MELIGTSVTTGASAGRLEIGFSETRFHIRRSRLPLQYQRIRDAAWG